MTGIEQFRNLQILTIKYFRILAKKKFILEVFCSIIGIAPQEQPCKRKFCQETSVFFPKAEVKKKKSR